mmetsp:Transcript_48666/g.54429  ORF Transcript_48666/g.54429 Transcript_48666/m.54429 type:complete len:387 (+) Transcript_48666:75-1235(+)
MAEEEEVKENCPSSSSSSIFSSEDFWVVILGLVTLMGSALTYFMQRNRERLDSVLQDKKHLEDLDRQQALERVRTQMSVFVGPLHRLWKTQNTILSQYSLHYRVDTDIDYFRAGVTGKDGTYWMTLFNQAYVDPFIEQPMSIEAQRYRHMISRRLQPIYTRIRELGLAHGSDLADWPTQDEWLQKYDRQTVTSPYVASMNINVVFDTYTAWTFEFDDIIESWKENDDFSRMQPSTEVAWLLCNVLVDMLYDNAKMKEAKYNKHVKVHRNVMEEKESTVQRMERIRSASTNYIDKMMADSTTLLQTDSVNVVQTTARKKQTVGNTLSRMLTTRTLLPVQPDSVVQMTRKKETVEGSSLSRSHELLSDFTHSTTTLPNQPDNATTTTV